MWSQGGQGSRKGVFSPDPKVCSGFSHEQGMQIQHRRDFNTAFKSAQMKKMFDVSESLQMQAQKAS